MIRKTIERAVIRQCMNDLRHERGCNYFRKIAAQAVEELRPSWAHGREFTDGDIDRIADETRERMAKAIESLLEEQC